MGRCRVVPLAPLMLLVLSGCGSSEEAGSAESAQTAETSETEATAAAEASNEAEESAQEAEEAAAPDLAGLSVTVQDDGTIILTGPDRWGGRLERTFADAEYFENAVPVLKRWVTDEQGAALEAYAAELRGASETAETAENPGEDAVEGAAEAAAPTNGAE